MYSVVEELKEFVDSLVKIKDLRVSKGKEIQLLEIIINDLLSIIEEGEDNV